jgi:hypothetical protein
MMDWLITTKQKTQKSLRAYDRNLNQWIRNQMKLETKTIDQSERLMQLGYIQMQIDVTGQHYVYS